LSTEDHNRSHFQVGDEAEILAEQWGNQAGFLVHRASRDRHGWDQLFEFSLPRSARIDDLPGTPESALACRVQVKALRFSKRSVSIKLSNWKRSIEDPLPWFVLVIRFEGTRRIPVLIHIGKAQIERVIARLCELPEEAQSSLHRKSMSVDVGSGTVLDVSNERSLVDAIESAMGNDAFAYARKKQKWCRNAGYEPGNPLDIHVSVGPLQQDEFFKRIARSAVGLGDELVASKAVMSRRRFGRDQTLPIKIDRLSINWSKVPGRPIQLGIVDDKHISLATLPVTMHASAAAFPLPREYWIFRLRSPILDILVDNTSGRFSLESNVPGDDELVQLKTLHENLAFLNCLHDNAGREISISLSREGFSVTLVKITPIRTLGQRQHVLADNTSKLWTLLGHLGAAESNVQFTPNQISTIAPAANIMLMARIGPDHRASLDFSINPDDPPAGSRITILTNPNITIGPITYVDLIAFSAIPTVHENESGESVMRLVPDQYHLLSSRQYAGGGLKHFDFDSEARGLESELDKAGFEHVFAMEWKSIKNADAPA
jgi:hypothetical protein